MARVFTIDGAGMHAHAVPYLGQDNVTRFSGRETLVVAGGSAVAGLLLGLLAGLFWGRR